MSLAPGTRLGPYEILAPVGAGGMGEVYKACDKRLDRTVAIKVLRGQFSSEPEFKRRFEREARAISSLSHPHICHLYDVGSQDGIEYFVMEYLEGTTLAERLQKGPLPLDQVLNIAAQISEALDKAHRSGIVHRDLKPGNIMLSTSGVKLMDFGLAKPSAIFGLAASIGGSPLTPSPTMTIASLAAPLSPLTQQGAVLGTLPYMAPEVLQGREADARSDIFSLGCVLYEMATGRRAFPGESQLSVITAILEKDPEPIIAVQPLAPPAFEYLVRTCVAKNPDERWQSAADVARNFQLVKTTTSQAPAKSATKGALLYVLAAACLLLVFVAAWLALRPRRTGGAEGVGQGRFSFAAPVSAQVTYLAVSGDGRQIAFVNDDVLWIRTLDSDTPRKLPGTAGVIRYPFWSPDQRFIGFFTNFKLRRVSAADGTVQDICEVPGTSVAGGTWNSDDVILIGNWSGPLWRVSAHGGEPIPVLKLDSQKQEARQLWPWFLPDGRRFVFLSQSGTFLPTGRNREIDIADLSGTTPRRLLLVNSNAQYAARRLVYVKDGALVAQEFEPISGTLSGQPALLQGNVNFRAAFGLGVFGAAPALLAHSPRQREYLGWVTRDGNHIGRLGPEGGLASFDVAPDGKSAVVEMTHQQSGNGELWLLDLERKVSTRLTLDEAAWNWAPIWSADGKKVYFSSTRTGISDLYERNIGTSEERQLLSGGTYRLAPLDVSRDGRYLLYEELNRITGPDIWALPLTGERKPFAYLKTNYEESGARFSPDGRWVAYCSDESGSMEVYVQSFPVPGKKVRVSTEGGGDPRWRQDGRELYFVSADGQLMTTGLNAGADFQVSDPKPLFRIGLSPDLMRRHYWPGAEGARFLVIEERSDSAAVVNIALNWTEALKK